MSYRNKYVAASIFNKWRNGIAGNVAYGEMKININNNGNKNDVMKYES
jgi:hypothetical protein